MANTSTTVFHRLDDFATQYGSDLPQVVRVGKGFTGTSVDQCIETGEILIICKVEREKKILARQLSRGREICFPRSCDLKVELVTDPSQDVYSTLEELVKLPSRYIRVLESITSFGLFAGDVLQLIREPRNSNGCNVRCLIVSLKVPSNIDLPRSLEGKFQALSNYGVLSVDEVLKECSHSANVRLVTENTFTCSERATSLPVEECGNIQLEYEIEEETVFAISTLKENRILIFPITLDISVAQFTPQQAFLSRSGTDYKRLVNAIENDKVLHDKINTDCVYFTSDPVKRYSLEMFQVVSFPFDRKQMVVTTGRRDATGENKDTGLESPALQQNKHESKGTEPSSFSENKEPPLPPKMTLIATKGHNSSKKDQVRNTESKQESEKQCTSSDIHRKQEVPSGYLQNDLNDRSLFRHRSKVLSGSKERETNSKMRILGDSFSESEEAVFSVTHSKRTAYEPQPDVNANLPSTSGVLTDNKQNPSLVDFLQPTQAPCYLARNLPEIRPNKEAQGRGASLLRKPLTDMENDLSQVLTAENSEEPKEGEEHARQNIDRSLSEQSDDYNEEDNNTDYLVFDCSGEFSDGYRSNVQYGRQGSVETAERQGELKSPESISKGDKSPANGDSPKKKFFQSLTRKPKWFRQDASKPPKKDRAQTLRTKTTGVRIPPRHANSCEDILISSPRDDDFECMTSITKYLETQEKLNKALGQISRLQNQLQGRKDSETPSKPKGSKECFNAQDKSPNKSGQDWQRKESDSDIQGSLTQHETLPLTPANTPEDPDTSELPLPTLALKQSATSSQRNGESETNSRGDESSNDVLARAANAAIDSEPVLSPSYSLQRDNGHDTGRRESDDREPRHEDFNKACPFCDFTDKFGEGLPEGAAKNELKKAILQMNWSEDEWMELTNTVRKKINDTKRIRHQYVNLATPRETLEDLPVHPTIPVSPSYPDENEVSCKVKMPPYENISQGPGRPPKPPYQNIAPDSTQTSVFKEVQRLAIRSQGKPPIPTPRSERSSV